MPENKNKRFVAQQHHGWEELDPEMKKFWGRLTEELGYEPRFTSGKRSASDEVGKHAKTSHHNHGNAIDIEADTKAYHFLMNDIRGLQLLNDFGLGVLDETDPKMKAKTGATGDHFHIGPDTNLKEEAQERYKSLAGNPSESGYEVKHSYKSKVEQGLIDPSEEQEYKSNFSPLGRGTSGLAGFQQEVEIEKKKEKKEEKSAARKEIEESKKEIQLGKGFFENLASEMAQPTKASQPRASEFKPEDPIAIETQQGLPNMPNIFQDITKLQDGGMSGEPDPKVQLLRKAISQIASPGFVGIDIPDNEIVSLDQVYPEYRSAITKRYKEILKEIGDKDTLSK